MELGIKNRPLNSHAHVLTCIIILCMCVCVNVCGVYVMYYTHTQRLIYFC